MKLKIITIYFTLLAVLLSGCTYSYNLITPLKTKNQANLTKFETKNLKHFVLGSTNYVYEIKTIARKSGNQQALNRIMEDVDTYKEELDNNSTQNISGFYKLTSFIIGKIGHVDMKTHYFRNKLNRAPQSLEKLVELNSTLPYQKRWILLPARGSTYHMQGKDGEYNLKFIASDGSCEAVYNKNGILLTEKNDPVNMGTFNYSFGIAELNAHTKYDVDPYLKWGNCDNSPQKGKSEIQKGVNMALQRYMDHSSEILIYRKKILDSGFVRELQ